MSTAVVNNHLNSHAPMRHSESISGVAEFAQEAVESTPAAESSPFVDEEYINMASSGLGARVLFATDEWFAAASNLLKDSPPEFDPMAYCEQGKVMDGWETRRRREPGHDWCVIKLPSRATLFGVELDTVYFTGNHVPAVSIDVADLSCAEDMSMALGFPGIMGRLLHGCVQGTGATPDEVGQAEQACRSVQWLQLLPRSPLRPGYEKTRMHYFVFDKPMEGTHIRLNYFPDGGVARLRLWGIPGVSPTPKGAPLYAPIKTGPICTVVSHTEAAEVPSRQPFAFPELSSQENGGIGVACSNKHYGDPWNLIQSSLGRDMGDGWETARHPNRPAVLLRDPKTNLVDSPLSDWCIIKLGSVAGEGLQRIILDTKHFRGNYPESVSVEGCYLGNEEDALVTEDGVAQWFTLVPRCRMAPDSEHVFDRHQIINANRKVSHVRVTIFPDGGLSRIRLFGTPGELQ